MRTPLNLALMLAALNVAPAIANPAGLDWQPVGAFDIARTETTVAQFRRFVTATGTVTAAERAGGGDVYEAGWVKKPGWTWRMPFGVAAADDEPAVHLDFGEAMAFCRWAGGSLPTDAQWLAAAYTEQRAAPTPPFERGCSYRYPVGDSPAGAMCLDDCGVAAQTRAVKHGARLWRGVGHALAGSTPPGVNGLHEMGGNVWEWVDEPPSAGSGAGPATERRTRGGSWWYGAAQMQAEHLQSKPPGTTVVYIGFRCARGGNARVADGGRLAVRSARSSSDGTEHWRGVGGAQLQHPAFARHPLEPGELVQRLAQHAGRQAWRLQQRPAALAEHVSAVAAGASGH